MSWLWAAAFFLLSTQVIAQTITIPPDWIVRGFEAALADGRQDVGSAAVVNSGDELAENVPPGERAGAAIDKLLPLLADSDRNLRSAAARALAAIPPGERAGAAIDKLLPLLADSHRMRSAAAQALAAGDRATVIDKLLPLLADNEKAAARALAAIPPRNVSMTLKHLLS
jgi:HEAT repeat protein